jgi:hypothetical protein
MDDLEARSRCRVCGWLFSCPVWDEDPEEGATYDICPSCGCEAGNQDFTLESTQKHREAWIKAGMRWQAPDQKIRPIPFGWDPVEQMKYIPPGWL